MRPSRPTRIEEAYEVADAIARNDLDDLRDELGDLLLQVVFHARMAEEQGAFDFGDVVQTITEKISAGIRTCSATSDGITPDAVKGLWERIKAEEKAERARAGHAGGRRRARRRSGQPAPRPDARDGTAAKAANVGFDWNDPRRCWRKIREEADEIEAALASGNARDRRRNRRSPVRARQPCPPFDADPEAILRATNQNSSAASARSSGRSPRNGKPRDRRRSPRWMRCGTRPRRTRPRTEKCRGPAPRGSATFGLELASARRETHMTPYDTAFRSILAAVICVTIATPLAAQPWPTRTLRIVTATPAGGSPDFVSRLLADKLAPRLGQAVVVENAAVSGVAAWNNLAKAQPDGYTIGMLTGAFSARAAVAKSLPSIRSRTLLSSPWSPAIRWWWRPRRIHR